MAKQSQSFKNEAFSKLNFNNFRKVKNIWGYFYRNKFKTNLISDGVIEQWEFGNAEDAEEVLQEISTSRGDIIYFNTMPFFCRIDNKLIIFQTRAMAFSYDQKAVFQKFIEKYQPNIWDDNEKVSKKYKTNKNVE